MDHHELTRDLIWIAPNLIVSLLVYYAYFSATFGPSERYLTFVPRFWTGIVDQTVLWPLTFAVDGVLSFDLGAPLVAAFVIVQELFWLFYTIGMHACFGQTIGKMVTKIRVVDFKTLGPITLRQASIREGIPFLVSLGAMDRAFHVPIRLRGRVLAVRSLDSDQTGANG